MGLYIFIFFALLILSFQKYNKYVYGGTLLILFLMAGLRDDIIGNDTHSYKDIYRWISDGILYSIEPSWYFLNQLVALFNGHFTVILFVASLLTLMPICIIGFRSGYNPQMILFFYYALYAYLNSFNLMRQLLAVSLVLLAYSYIQNKKKYFLWTLLAVSFHFSAIISLLALPIEKKYLNKQYILKALFLSFILGCLLNDTVFSVVTGPYARYLDGNFGYRENFISSLLMAIFMNLLFLFSFSTIKDSFKQTIWTKVFFVGILVMNATLQLKLGTRLILYLTMSQVVFYTIYIYNNKFKNKRTAVLIVLLYVLIIFLKILILGNQSEYSVYPYKSIL